MSSNNLYIFTILVALVIVMALLFISLQNSDKIDEIKNVIPDSVITANIKSMLLAEDTIKSLSIHVETINGKVILDGVVPDDDTKNKIESIAENTSGVEAVESLLSIKSD